MGVLSIRYVYCLRYKNSFSEVRDKCFTVREHGYSRRQRWFGVQRVMIAPSTVYSTLSYFLLRFVSVHNSTLCSTIAKLSVSLVMFIPVLLYRIPSKQTKISYSRSRSKTWRIGRKWGAEHCALTARHLIRCLRTQTERETNNQDQSRKSITFGRKNSN